MCVCVCSVRYHKKTFLFYLSDGVSGGVVGSAVVERRATALTCLKDFCHFSPPSKSSVEVFLW